VEGKKEKLAQGDRIVCKGWERLTKKRKIPNTLKEVRGKDVILGARMGKRK